MKLSVSGFKSISKVDVFDFRPLTLLAGINSSGKSSLIQAILLLKQSFESDGSMILDTQGEYVSASEPIDLVHAKDKKRKIQYEMNLDATEITNAESYRQYLPDNVFLAGLCLQLDFSVNGTSHLERLQLDLIYGCKEQARSFKVLRTKSNNTYSINYSVVSMVNDNAVTMKNISTGYTLSFKNSFLPVFGERNGEFISFSIIKNLRDTLENLFKNISYIGPQRVKPELARSYKKLDFDNVGISGENTRFLLNEKKNEIIDGYDKTLVDLVNEWMVERMGLAKSISVTRDANRLYRVTIKNELDIPVDLCQTGFGLSQLLPIITQGFLTPQGGTLIVEDPDVHMHPRIQAEVVNFFVNLISHGRKIIIETHSDHIVTRMRLLLAQTEILKNDEVNVCFVTNNFGHSEYRTCALTKEGMFSEPLPKGFMDSQEHDFKEIIRTQLQTKKDEMAGCN